MDIHPQIAVLAPLIGIWRGTGHGEYPTIEPFDYTEEVEFRSTGKPFLLYTQRTWSPDGTAMHMETGFLRAAAPGTVEFVIAQPMGQAELAEGGIGSSAGPDGAVLTLDLTARILNSATAKTVDSTHRSYQMQDGALRTSFAMAAVGVPMTHHLASVLTRTGPLMQEAFPGTST